MEQEKQKGEEQKNTEGEEEEEGNSDLLSAFMRLRDEKGQPFSDLYLKDMILNFLIAGRDTTANLLTWTAYLVAQHPEVEEKLLEEHRRVLSGVVGEGNPSGEDGSGDHPPSRKEEGKVVLTGSLLKKLKYTQQVLEEALRLYPAVPLDFRQAIEDDVLPNGVFVGKGEFIGYSAYITHRSPKYWENPEKFDPDRFSSNHSSHNKLHPYQFVPFHGGPQRCLGQKMALLEAKVMCYHLFNNFKLSIVPDHPVQVHKSVTLRAKFGIKAFVEKRS